MNGYIIRIHKTIISSILVFTMLTALCFSAFATAPPYEPPDPPIVNPNPETLEFFAPVGGGRYEFSVELPVDTDKFFSGVQYTLKTDDQQKLELASFTASDDFKNFNIVKNNNKTNEYQFGIYSTVQTKTGALTIGAMNFSYTGTEPITATMTDMKFIGIDGKKTYWFDIQPSPVMIINVSRETPKPPDDDKKGGNTGTGGGGGSGTPFAPAVAGAGGDGSADAGDGEGEGEGEGDIIDIFESQAPVGAANLKRSLYFDDVPEEDWPWAVFEIDTLYEMGVIKGTGERLYSPAANITRGDFMLMLARAYNLFDDFDENFGDVPKGSYYYDAIGSAKKCGVALGVGENNYEPDSPITRQDMMSLIYRTLDTFGTPVPIASDSVLLSFDDYELISDYAKIPVAALVQAGIIIGDGHGVKPLHNTTRAEMAVVIYRLLTD